MATHRWYTRPVLFVSDVNRALHFYTEILGFKKAWHKGDGQGKVCQVDGAGSEIILCEDARREIAGLSIPNKESLWGYDVIQIDDPDGNELLFPLSDIGGTWDSAT